MLTHTLIYAGLLPFAVSAAFSFVLGRWRVSPKIAWAVAVASGFLAGQLALKSGAGVAAAVRSFLQPLEAGDWLPLVVLLAVGVSILLLVAPPSRRHIALAIVFALSVPIRLLAGGLAQQWTALEKVAYLALAAAAYGLLWILLSVDRDEAPHFIRPLLLVLVAAGIAVVLAQSGSLVYGQSSGAVAAAIAGTALAFWLSGSAASTQFPALASVGGAAGVITFSLGSLVILGHFYAGLDAANTILLLIALAAAGGPLPGAVARRPALHRVPIRATACLVPLAIALVRAVSI